MKLKLTILAAIVGGVMSSSAATMFITNVSNGPGDTLWALNNNSLMSSGIVAMGYFPTGVNPTTIAELVANLGTFTAVTTVAPGTAGVTLGVGAAGYAEGTDSNGVLVPGSPFNAGNAIIGRTVYQIATDSLTLNGATTANQFALISFGTFLGDEPSPQAITGSITNGGTRIISGGTDTFTAGASFAGGEGSYNTLKLATAVPEPSAALLGVIGALGLLRRRRI